MTYLVGEVPQFDEDRWSAFERSVSPLCQRGINSFTLTFGTNAGKKLAGAGIGSIVGSVILGVGTAIVAGIGTVAGTAAVEWAGIKLDEAVNREQLDQR